MNTDKRIKDLVAQLDIYQLRTILNEYYSNADNPPASVYNALQKEYSILAHEVTELVKSDEIDEIVLIQEIYS